MTPTMTVVATAGHVDHGKSTLVEALTGVDPDRLAEEKARGLTIDLGFAVATLPSGVQVGFVDVPGHVRFIKNMLAGVGAVQACLFVVSAAEGWKPQSEEHLRILELLGVRHGLVALTNVGRLDREWNDLARMDLESHVEGSFLQDCEVVEVDVPAGIGLGDLTAALDRLILAAPPAVDRARPRLWIDRSFAARGAGTVCTGTLTGGTMAVDQTIDVLGHHRATGRIRALQSHGQPLVSAQPGRRLAVNLASVVRHDARRGDALVVAAQWAPTTVVDAELSVLASLDHEVSRRGDYHAYFGSGEYAVKLRLLQAHPASPGDAALARLWLPVALPLLPGDRYVLRESGRSETVGGGQVLDVAPVLPASRAKPYMSIDRVVAERGWVEVETLERITGETVEPNVGGRWVASPEAIAGEVAHLRQAVERAGRCGVELASCSEMWRALAAVSDGIVVRDGRAFDQAAAVEDDPGRQALLDALVRSPFEPPAPAAEDRQMLRELVKSGLVADCDGIFFATEAVDRAAAVVSALLEDSPDGVTVAQVRQALSSSRKYVLPLLVHMDRTGVTRRRGDLRIGGPLLRRRPGGPGPLR